MLFKVLYIFFTFFMMSKQIMKPYIHGKNLELLKQLIQDGYVYTGKNRNRLRFLQKIFPSIKRSQFKNKSIYYLEDKNKLALRTLMRHDSSRIISFQELGRMSQVFNTDLEIQPKRVFLGKYLKQKQYKIKKFNQQYQSGSQEKQTLLDDFLGRFLHLEVLCSSSSESVLKQEKTRIETKYK